ncbi:hypothetical protein WN944_003207 [Citrus x changshan-huyou]|uniref:Uncharacterized protein n=1 Tax=Citrus x changshan-huyou TaxID=2935761 RepID=A0AAP0M2Q9_9ROSI
MKFILLNLFEKNTFFRSIFFKLAHVCEIGAMLGTTKVDIATILVYSHCHHQAKKIKKNKKLN